MELIKKLYVEEEGQGLVEYALIIGLIALAVMAALGPVGDIIKVKFNEITTGLGGTLKN